MLKSFCTASQHVVTAGSVSQDRQMATFCLLLPGKMLYISALLASKRFRDKGNKEGVVKAIKMLEEAGIGRVIEDKPPRGATVVSFCALLVFSSSISPDISFHTGIIVYSFTIF